MHPSLNTILLVLISKLSDEVNGKRRCISASQVACASAMVLPLMISVPPLMPVGMYSVALQPDSNMATTTGSRLFFTILPSLLVGVFHSRRDDRKRLSRRSFNVFGVVDVELDQ